LQLCYLLPQVVVIFQLPAAAGTAVALAATQPSAEPAAPAAASTQTDAHIERFVQFKHTTLHATTNTTCKAT
jgi:hypothetical protein